MAKRVVKILGVILAIALLTVPTVFAATPVFTDVIQGRSDEGMFSVTVGDYVMNVDKSNLNMSVTKGDKTWYSGKRFSEEDGLNNSWVAKLTDAITVGYRDLSTNISSEGALSRLGGTVKFTEKADGFDAKVTLGRIGIVLTMQVRLANGKITVTVPNDSIKENSETVRLQYLNIYPFFDSSYSLTDGKIFVPDGSGAVIDLSKKTSAKQAYSARVYGDDYGISFSKLSSTSPQTATLPMFALMYNDHGTMVTADSGAEYSSINAYASSITTQYNMAYFTWIYREIYVKYYESSGSDGRSYFDFQAERNNFDLVQTMTLFDDETDVADIAKAYRSTLELKSNDINDAGLKIKFLMADNKQGMFGREVVVMTTTDYIQSVAREIAEYCNNLHVSVWGYTRGGLDGSYPNHFPLENKAGNKRAYSNMSNALSEMGLKLSFTTDFMRAYEDASVRESNLALNISTQFINVTDKMSGSLSKYNLLTLDGIASQVKGDVATIKNYNATVDYQSFGSMLYSSYKNQVFSRTDAMQKLVEIVKSTETEANLYNPNAYMFSVLSSYLDAPLSSSGYMVETESVPMLQMILSGKVPMYSPAINLNYTGRKTVLRLIDYNVYPSFTLTEQDAIDLYGTNSSGLFTSSYSIWKDSVREIYNEVNGVLSKVAGATAEDRFAYANGVYVTQYSNGVYVIVNYTDADVSVSGNTVPAQSAITLTNI